MPKAPKKPVPTTRKGATPKSTPKPKAMPKPKQSAVPKDQAALMPHEVLLAVARGETIADHIPTFEERVEAAKAAAPYFAAKSASTAVEAGKPALDHEAALAALDQSEPAHAAHDSITQKEREAQDGDSDQFEQG
jgi:acetyl esterase/lipase